MHNNDAILTLTDPPRPDPIDSLCLLFLETFRGGIDQGSMVAPIRRPEAAPAQWSRTVTREARSGALWTSA